LEGEGQHNIMCPVRKVSIDQTIRNISFLNYHKFIIIIIIIIIIDVVLGLGRNPLTLRPQVRLYVPDDR
jgi:hypothetical protein